MDEGFGNPRNFIDFVESMGIVRPASYTAWRGWAFFGACLAPLSMESRLFITPAFAQGAPAAGGTDMILQFVPFILIFVIMWFLIIRPQQKRVKTHQEMIKNVRRGDTVVTSGGIIGRVTKVLEESADIEIEIADGVKVKVARAMIAEVRAKGEPVKA
jgi:preprotein translocase subunit YajC